MRFIWHLWDLIQFMKLPRKRRQLTFYSEGKNYWPHLEGLLRQILASTNLSVCYISSGDDDPGLQIDHPNCQTFKIDEGFIRDWLFENIETDVMVMTMPDLHQYQVKRSKHNVHYVYIQHSLVSLHMIYRKGAFDHYDTIFCAGPHHIQEIRAMEAAYNLPPKRLVEHGYGRLDAIIEEANKQVDKNTTNDAKHVLIAPSWGPEGTLESGVGALVVNQLIEKGYKVTLRPHPKSLQLASDKIDSILEKHAKNPLFTYEENVAGQQSLHDSDVMISDWSGAALDYAFGLNKPVLFIDVPRKVNNLDYKEIELEPIEVEIRSSLGGLLHMDHISDCGKILDELFSLRPEFDELTLANVFNVGESSKIGSNVLREICNEG